MASISRLIASIAFLAPLLGMATAALSAEPPPPSRVVGTTRPFPQGLALHPTQPAIALLKANGAVLKDLDTLEVTRRLGIDEPPSSSVVFSPDGSLIAVGHDQGVISVWRPDGRRVTWTRGHLDRVLALAFSPDGRWLASGGLDGTIQIWSTANWNRVATLDGIVRLPSLDNSQAVVGLVFSDNNRALFSIETIYRNPDRRTPDTRVVSAWEAGTWIETGRLTTRLKGMSVNGYANPFDAPLALSTWGRSHIIVPADDGYGYPKRVVPPTRSTLRGIAVNDCFPQLDDPDDLFPSDTWPTALAADSNGWVAAAFLEGNRYQFSPGIALMPITKNGARRSWPTDKQSVQLAFDERDQLFSLSSDGQVIGWRIGQLNLLSPGNEDWWDTKPGPCRPANEASAAQLSTPVAGKVLTEAAKWTLDPALKEMLLSWPDFRDRFSLADEKLTLWGPRGRVILEAKTGVVLDRDPPLSEHEFLLPSRSSSVLYIAQQDALVAHDVSSGERRTLETEPGWKLVGAVTAGEFFATAWKEAESHANQVEFHVFPSKGGPIQVFRPLAFRDAAIPKNLSVSTYPGSPMSFLLSPNGRWLAYVATGAVPFEQWIVLDTRTGKSQRLSEPLQAIEGTRWLEHDRRWMGLSVFDLATGKYEARLRRHLSRMPAAADRSPNAQAFLGGSMSGGGRYVVSGAFDGSLKVWDLESRAEIAVAAAAPANFIAIGHDRTDDNVIFTLQWDGIFTLWRLEEAPR